MNWKCAFTIVLSKFNMTEKEIKTYTDVLDKVSVNIPDDAISIRFINSVERWTKQRGTLLKANDIAMREYCVGDSRKRIMLFAPSVKCDISARIFQKRSDLKKALRSPAVTVVELYEDGHSMLALYTCKPLKGTKSNSVPITRYAVFTDLQEITPAQANVLVAKKTSLFS